MNLEDYINKYAAVKLNVSRLERRIGGQQTPLYLSDKQEETARKSFKKSKEESFSLRHPWLTGIPTLGIAPAIASTGAYERALDTILRKYPSLAKEKRKRWVEGQPARESAKNRALAREALHTIAPKI